MNALSLFASIVSAYDFVSPFPPSTIYRLLVFSSALVKHCFLGHSSGLNLNLTVLETSSEPRPR